ncbi:hypothetical protein B0A48_09365 [Cryoendolithus antarcticus]|uniref:Altered inheritance of mitochondria protein 24, mitochondrial n=1 Tax=Cryoendolithus antarcticus TaxID=1507870 RepID=A0A1V8SZ58_9PEZI|nr:hypothetical protein B0A48_09365 [Cryoendolithus antarcticus]
MRHRILQPACASCRHTLRRSNVPSRRLVHISPTPSSTEPSQSLSPASASSASTTGADARFEVLSSPFSLLSASISASQNLYARKGTLVGFNGKPEDAVSTLSLLGPFRRAFLGVPFVYQKVTSNTPYTALIATRSAITSMVVVHLDGRLDWIIAQRNALLAWTGHTLSLSPRVNTKMSLAHWGNTHVTGRGLLALSGRGQIHQVTLKTGEEYVLHPSNVVAYSQMPNAPQAYRFKANVLRLQIPKTAWFSESRFWRTMRETTIWRFLSNTAYAVRTTARRTIWGDRLFLHFRGPVTILIQSRGGALRDVLTARDVNEIADSPAGIVPPAKSLTSAAEAGASLLGDTPATNLKSTSMSFATVRSGKVDWEKTP